MKNFWRLFLAVLMSFVIAVCCIGCGAELPDNGGNNGSGGDITQPKPDPDPDDPDPTPPVETVGYDSSYTPSLFDVNTLKYTVTHLGDGVRLVKNEFTRKANNKPVAVYAVEVDLKQADIKSGCYDNSPENAFGGTKQVPYKHMEAYERDNEGVKVLVATNADFFNPGNGISVNAFVKDGIIIKDSHNDKGAYDYKNLDADVPASAPMLFGIKGETAQIAPIKKYTGDAASAAVKESLIKSKLYYTGVFSNSSTTLHALKTNVNPYDEIGSVVYLDDTSNSYQIRSRSAVVVLTLNDNAPATVKSVRTISGIETVKPNEGEAIVVAHPDYAKAAYIKTVTVGKTFNIQVTSEDGTWNGYDTILGCRQALVINKAIPDTVAKENSNGAERTNIPRTAIGVKSDGKAVLFSVEALTYGKYGSAEDTVGLSLPELADFIRYYNCINAANFDGGGSTQLIVREGSNGAGDPKVLVRSSDTGSTTLTSTRAVSNSLLITLKKK